jgi:hypothetical protein
MYERNFTVTWNSTAIGNATPSGKNALKSGMSVLSSREMVFANLAVVVADKFGMRREISTDAKSKFSSGNKL